MIKKLFSLVALTAAVTVSAGNVYYVSTTGSDSNAGTKDAPFATLGAAQNKVTAGDTIYFRGGTYTIQQSEIMTSGSGTGSYSYVFDLKKSGNASNGRIVYAGYPGERPVFDFQNVLPQSRISGFYLHGSYLHLKNFDIIGIKATMHGHFQCECISARNGSNCIVENVSMHDNMAIGYYAIKGSNNLVLNCDAYCNYDDYSAFQDCTISGVTYTADQNYNYYKSTGTVRSGAVSETLGGNCDGFGFHAYNASCTGNVFRGCRAWWNSDDGFDCINSKAAVVWDSCWAFYNGYEPLTIKSRGDGNGFKAGGYGMSVPCSGYAVDASGNPAIPQNTISNCVAYYNKINGFYANHHLGGNLWLNNTAYYNANNYNMLNRELATIATAAVNVDGYNHILRNNVSCKPRGTNCDIVSYDASTCTLENNYWSCPATSFLSYSIASTLSNTELTAARNADGSLPEIKLLTAHDGGTLQVNNQGALFEKGKISEVDVKEADANHNAPVKVIENGQIVIILNGVRYGINGIRK